MNSKIIIKEVLVLAMLGTVWTVGYFYIVVLTVLQNLEVTKCDFKLKQNLSILRPVRWFGDSENFVSGS